MGDNDYENIDGWYPILIDGQRDPWVSWWEHRQRGSLGGVDCVANVGTPIHAPANCYINNIDVESGGSGGRTTIATFNDGWKDVFMHLQSQVPEGSYQKGMTIGYTGRSVASGYPLVAQHLHWHRIGNYYYDPYGRTNRYNPWNYFTGSGTAGGGATPIRTDDEELFSAEGQAWLINWGNNLGQAIIEQVRGDGQYTNLTMNTIRAVRSDIGWIHQGPSSDSLQKIHAAVKATTPTTIKAALDATGVRLTDAQEAELISRIVAAL